MEAKIKSVETVFDGFDIEICWDITMNCNYSCSYCGSYDNSQPTYFKTMDEYKKAIDYITKHFDNKTMRVSLLGGEPIIYKHWVDLVNTIYDKGHIVKMYTNLSIKNTTLIKKIKNLKPKKCIFVSWHPQFVDVENIMKNIKTLAEEDLLDSVTILADRRYWSKVEEAVELTKYFNGGLTHIKDVAEGKIAITSGLIDYTEDELKYIEENQPMQQYPFKTTLKFFNGDEKLIKNADDLIMKELTNFKGLNCMIGSKNLFIKPNGDAYPSACLFNHPKAVVGNIYKQNLMKPKRGIRCPFNICACGPDVRINKYADVGVT